MESIDKITILVTGGAGYIGAHTVRALSNAGHKVIVIDNLSTGKQANLAPDVIFIQGDFADPNLLDKVFDEHKINAVMHFAASIEVGESVEKPIEYLYNNSVKTSLLLKVMVEHDVKNFIFSSTAAVYGLQEQVPIPETAGLGPLDPYGFSKMLTEQVIEFYTKFTGLNAIIFRYFNACGSDFDKTIYSKHESHLIPRVIDVAEGRRSEIEIYGTDYNTPDGTGVRDYVHVLDIAAAHVLALENFDKSNFQIYNIGTSKGLSVKEIISAVENITGKTVPVKISKRREGDSPITIADNSKIKTQLGFELKHSDLETIIKTSLH